MNKKSATILILFYSISVFSASAQTTMQDWTCPAGEEFPVYQDGREVTVQCGPNGTSATLNGCENMTNVESGPCYQEPESVTGQISETADGFLEKFNNLDQNIKLIAATGILLAVAFFFYEYFHG